MLAFFLACASLTAPTLLPPEWPWVRTVIAFAATFSCFRLFQIARRPERYPRARRVGLVVLLIDPSWTKRVAPRVDLELFALGCLFGAGALVALRFAHGYAPGDPYSSPSEIARAMFGGVFTYCLVDAAERFIRAALALLGYRISPLHRAPILSRSLAEFWTERWSMLVSRWMKHECFAPVAMRFGAAAGILATFFASAVLHFLPLALVTSVRAAAFMGAFFIIQGFGVILERRLSILRWPSPWRRVWTVFFFVATVPLFAEPMLQTVGL